MQVALGSPRTSPRGMQVALGSPRTSPRIPSAQFQFWADFHKWKQHLRTQCRCLLQGMALLRNVTSWFPGHCLPSAVAVSQGNSLAELSALKPSGAQDAGPRRSCVKRACPLPIAGSMSHTRSAQQQGQACPCFPGTGTRTTHWERQVTHREHCGQGLYWTSCLSTRCSQGLRLHAAGRGPSWHP